MERTVFEHHGTLDKFLGDGLMATFGTPDPGPNDAANAIRCVLAMLAEMNDWNAERSSAGNDPIKLSVGVHYGDVVLGEVGSERRLEFTVLGDVVNVASRLEGLTRILGTRAVISDALVTAVKSEKIADRTLTSILGDFQPGEQQALRGRDNKISVWTLA